MAAAASTSPDYGLDAPIIVRSMFSRGGWTLAFALVIYFINRVEYPGPAARLAGVLVLIALLFIAVGAIMIWSSRVGKLQMREKLIDSLALRGDEKVLDAGCGLGLLTVGIAKRLKTGKVTGLDIWDPHDLSGNSADAARQNAKLEGVTDKVRFEQGDVRKLASQDNQYDVVVSSLTVHNLPDQRERAQAVREMYRVLKPGGRLLLYDIFRTGEYVETLNTSGAKEVTLSDTSWLWCVPSRTVSARK